MSFEIRKYWSHKQGLQFESSTRYGWKMLILVNKYQVKRKPPTNEISGVYFLTHRNTHIYCKIYLNRLKHIYPNIKK